MENEQGIENVKNITKQESFFKKIFKGIGVGGAVIGGGLLYLVFTVIRFLYIALAGLSMVWSAILLFQKGSIIWGLAVLIIGTPIAIGVASYLFIPLLLFSIVALVIWGIASIFGLHTSFNNIWEWLWLAIKVLILGGMAFFGIAEFINSVKQKRIVVFFKENWFYFPLFLFLFWLFFLNSGKNSAEVSQLPVSNTGFVCISKTEQDRLAEIISGVADNSIPISDSLKNEFQGIFTKCNTSQKDISWYATFSPAIVITNYESLFLPDVLASFEAGVPVKSKDRQTFEDLVLSNGMMTTSDIAEYNSDIGKIIRGQPIGAQKTVITKTMITDSLSDTQAKLYRINMLFAGL